VLGLALFILFDLVASDEATYDSKVINADRDARPNYVRVTEAELNTFSVMWKVPARDNEVHWSSLTVPASYLIGSVASMWMFERVVGFWA